MYCSISQVLHCASHLLYAFPISETEITLFRIPLWDARDSSGCFSVPFIPLLIAHLATPGTKLPCVVLYRNSTRYFFVPRLPFANIHLRVEGMRRESLYSKAVPTNSLFSRSSLVGI
jgi:hypothetical protein